SSSGTGIPRSRRPSAGAGSTTTGASRWAHCRPVWTPPRSSIGSDEGGSAPAALSPVVGRGHTGIRPARNRTRVEPVMIGSNEWWEWGRQIALAVTEPHALHRARMIVRGVVAESEAVSDSRRGDAEIHTVNLAQGTPVTMSPRLASMVRSALWAARMTGGAVTPVDSDDASVDAGAIPPIHPIPTYRDVQVDGDIVLAPFGVSLELGATAVADTVDYSAAL